MTNSELVARVRELDAAASPGPWSQGMVGDRLINEVDNAAAYGAIIVTRNLSDDGADGIHDAQFIAESRLLLPALATAVEELEAINRANAEVAGKAWVVEELNGRLAAALRDLVDDDPCSYDHHGYCQTHLWFRTEPPCPQKRGRALLAETNNT